MSAVWDLQLGDSDKIVLLALADNANDEGSCWPSIATIARKCSKDERTVQRVISRLIDAGHISRVERSGTSNIWKVHPRHDDTPGTMPPRQDVAPPPVTVPPKPSRIVISVVADATTQRDVFPKPEWADPIVWKDWLAVRKAKKAKNTATAHKGFLSDIGRYADADWTPSRILEHAVRKSWAGIYDPRGNGNARQANGHQSASGYGRTIDAAIDFVREAEQGNSR